MTPISLRTLSLQRFSFGAGVAAALIGGSGMILLLLSGFLLNHNGLIYASIAWLAFLIPLFVGLLRRDGFDPFEPINLIALAILYGSSIRAVWLLTSTSSQVDLIMMGTDMEAVSANAPLMIGSILCLVAGYVAMPYRFPLERLNSVRNYAVNRRRLIVALSGVTAVSLAGIPWMIAEFGITFEQGFVSASMKRLAAYVGEDGELVYGAGYQRWLASAVQHGFVLLAAVAIAGLLKFRPPIVVALASMAALAAVTPYLTSSRGALLLLVLHPAIFAFYYGRLSVKAVVVAAVIAMPLVSFMGEVREANTLGARREISSVDRIFGSGNSLDLVRTSAIMDRVPEVVEYQYGRTYLALFAIGIPRAAWPDKPQIGLDEFVKGKIFGQRVRVSGWPAGMIAEGWINFGLFGLALPLFLFGAILRFLYETVKPLLGISFPVTLLYAVTIWRLGFGTIGLNLAHGVADTLTYVVPIFVLLYIARHPVGALSRAPYPLPAAAARVR